MKSDVICPSCEKVEMDVIEEPILFPVVIKNQSREFNFDLICPNCTLYQERRHLVEIGYITE